METPPAAGDQASSSKTSPATDAAVCASRASPRSQSPDRAPSPPSWTDVDGATHSQHLWPSGALLAQALWTRRAALEGRTVLELGAGGTGLPGMAALRAGAAQVLFTDHPSNEAAFRLLRRNLSANGLLDHSSVLGLQWGRLPLPDLPELNMVLLADCAFDPSVFGDLALTVAALVQREKQKPLVLHAYQVRDVRWDWQRCLRRHKLRSIPIPETASHAACVSVPGFEEELRRHKILLSEIRPF